MIKINYKSDFYIHTEIPSAYKGKPFKFIYYVPNGMNAYVVSFDGHNCTNCKMWGDGSIQSIMNIHQGNSISPIGLGRLKVERYFYLTNQDFVDGVENICSNEYTDILLVDGESDTLSEITDTVYYSMSNYYTKAQVQDLITPIILEINLAESDKAFANVDDFRIVHSAMLEGNPINFCIRVNYASGTKFLFYPTCVKANYISLNAKAGNLELHVNENGTFTKSGTNLW